MPTLGRGTTGVLLYLLAELLVTIRTHIYLTLRLTVQAEFDSVHSMAFAYVTHSYYLLHGSRLHNSKPNVCIWIPKDIGSDEAVVQLLHLQVHPQVLAGVLLRLMAQHGGHAKDG